VIGNSDRPLRRIDVNIIFKNSNTKYTTHILSDSHVGYMWGGIPPGKADYNVGMIPMDNRPIAEMIGPNYECRDWKLDNKVFQLPTDSNFTSDTPVGSAHNLIVLVHGCCTDENDVKEWIDLGNKIARKIINSKPTEVWEIIAWDWHKYTPKHDYKTTAILYGFLEASKLVLDDSNAAYDDAVDHDDQPGQGSKLADAIASAINESEPSYKYVHLIGHSAGVRLIHEASKKLADKKLKRKPFIHLTFLDAYTRTIEDSEGKNGYGYLEGYPERFAEHYVDIGLPGTDAILKNAFNFVLTDWEEDKKSEWWEAGHLWPLRWYTRSIEFPKKTGVLGFRLSLEGGYEAYSTLSQRFEPGENCLLTDVLTTKICEIKLPAQRQ
jgi:hypothetical protein